MKKQLNKIAKDTNIFLKKYINSQKYSQLMSPMKYGLFPGGKKIRSKILIDLGSLFSIQQYEHDHLQRRIELHTVYRVLDLSP